MLLQMAKFPSFLWLSGIPFREGDGIPLQYSCLENPTHGRAWWAAVHGVSKSRTRLSNFTFTFHFHALKKEMATHSSVLAWRIPGTGEPGGLPFMGSHRVGHNWSDLAALLGYLKNNPDSSSSIPLCVCIYIYIYHHIFFICDGHLDCKSWILF